MAAGCLDPAASNYDASASAHDRSLCEYLIVGCTDSRAFNFLGEAEQDSGGCIFPRYGCTFARALNYDSNADIIQGCIFAVTGCPDSSAQNFNPASKTALSLVGDGDSLDIIDNTTYSNEGDGEENIVIKKAGNYLL